jgi:thiamine biosynthesis lipoprotein
MRVKAVVLFCGFLMGCSPTQPQTQKLEGMAQGTTYHITYWSNEAVDNQLIETAIKTTFEDIDKNQLSKHLMPINPLKAKKWVLKLLA